MSPVDFTILPANWHDLSSLRVIERECFGKDAWPLFDLIGVLTLGGIARLKAVVNEAMVGFIAGDTRPAENLAWITTLGVLQAYRRAGIAKALLAACEDRMGMRRVRLCVRPDNEGAIKLYEQAGYRQIDSWKNYYGRGEDALVLQKERLTFA
jgi:ribosomal protein S18 acetylase RimI-like enzyme